MGHDSSFWQGMSRRKIRKDTPQRNVPNEGGMTQSYYGTVIGNRMQAIEWCHFQ